MGVRDQANADAAGHESAEHRRHFVIQLEVLAMPLIRYGASRAHASRFGPAPPICSMMWRV